MVDSPKILAFSGSLRKASYNTKLVRIAAASAEAAGAAVTVIDLADFPLPVFNEDLEVADGMPDSARRLKDLFLAHQGLLIAAPEYNSSITAALKNAIDWVSRPGEGEAPLAAFDGKIAAIMSASPGGLGGIRGLVTVRSILGNIKVIVLPDQVSIPQAHKAFDDTGALFDTKKQAVVAALGQKVADMVRKLV